MNDVWVMTEEDRATARYKKILLGLIQEFEKQTGSKPGKGADALRLRCRADKIYGRLRAAIEIANDPEKLERAADRLVNRLEAEQE